MNANDQNRERDNTLAALQEGMREHPLSQAFHARSDLDGRGCAPNERRSHTRPVPLQPSNQPTHLRDSVAASPAIATLLITESQHPMQNKG